MTKQCKSNITNSSQTGNVQEQVSLGGAKLFQFIAKLVKAFLNVDFDTHLLLGNPEFFHNNANSEEHIGIPEIFVNKN